MRFFRDFFGDTGATLQRATSRPIWSIVNVALVLSNIIRSGRDRRLSLSVIRPVWRPSLDCALSIPDTDNVVNPFFAFFLFLGQKVLLRLIPIIDSGRS